MTQYKHLPSDIGFSLLALVYNIGGAHESNGTRGISHLMEHLLCKTYDNLRKKLRRYGINYNAYTSDNRTVFYWEGLSEEIQEMTPELLSRLTEHKFLWTEEEFQMERSTVIQEYEDVFNDQFKGFYYNLMRKHYGICGPIGIREEIEAFTYEDSIKFTERYKNPNMVVQVGIDSLKDNVFGKALTLTPNELNFTNDSGLILENIPKEGKTIAGLLGSEPISKKMIPKISFLLGCLNDGLDSPMYQEIREKRGLSYFSASMCRALGDKFCMFFGASTTNDRAAELEEVYNNIFSGNMETFLDRERFEVCLDELKIQERKDKLLAHDGAARLVLSEENPYDVLRGITYEEVVELGNTYINKDKFVLVSH